jgi:hypothetical protein
MKGRRLFAAFVVVVLAGLYLGAQQQQEQPTRHVPPRMKVETHPRDTVQKWSDDGHQFTITWGVPR